MKSIALTFDDGPDNIKTIKILDKLKKFNVKATFFQIGRLIDDSTARTEKLIAEYGCEIGNHSFSWESMDNCSHEEILKSINETTERIKKYSGIEPAFFRPPNLAFSKNLAEIIPFPAIGGLPGYDWSGCNNGPEQIAQNILNSAVDGAIILLHDVQPFDNKTDSALDIIIPKLKDMDFEFLTLSQLFEKKEIDPFSSKEMWSIVSK